MTAVIFFVFAALALAGAFGVVLSRNPVHAALWLVVTLLSVAVFFVQQQAQLLAVVQIIVYAGAIVVLFLFVIMLLGVDQHESLHDPIPFQRPVAIALGVLLLAEVLFLAGHEWATGKSADQLHSIKGGATDLGGNVERVARVLFTDFLWPFEITSALLVIAVVGAVVLARRSGQRPGEEGRASRAADAVEEPVERASGRALTITATYYLVLAAGIFTVGAVGLLVRRNVIVMFMCVELMLNAVNLTIVSFARALNDVRGQALVFFTLVVAASEVAVGLGIIVAIFRRRRGATADDLDLLRDGVPAESSGP